MGSGRSGSTTSKAAEMSRGALVWVNLADATPPEMSKRRPALILSNTEQNQILSTVVVLPISSRPPEIWPLRLQVPKVAGLRESFVVIPGVRQVSKARIGESIGFVDDRFLAKVIDALAAYLG